VLELVVTEGILSCYFNPVCTVIYSLTSCS